MPIGNLTSQIFANIYMNEFDRFVKHDLKVKNYLRYGDDFIILADNLDRLNHIKSNSIKFLKEKLRLEINERNDIIIKAKWGLKFLGTVIFPRGRKLTKRNLARTKEKLDFKNISSYSGLLKKYSNPKNIKKFNWIILDYYDKQI
jgi:RNA-directed DNA polymerase